MPAPSLSGLHIYPIKSTAAIDMNRCWVERPGLAMDRRFMVCAPDGSFMTARRYPKLLQLRSYLLDTGVKLSAPGIKPLELSYNNFSQKQHKAEIWGDHVEGQHCHQDADLWLSSYLGTPCQLLWFGKQSERFTALQPDKPVGFADGYPILLISEASLADLNSRTSSSMTMAQFRPNLVISDTSAFAEDSWKRVRIGEVEFEVVKPCSRCVMTTMDPLSAQGDAGGEPLSTLLKYRKGDDGEVYFGQNLIPLNEGSIAIGDQLEILETQAPQLYEDNAPVLISTDREQQRLPKWQPDQEIALQCHAVINETPDTKTFRFKLPNQISVQYIPGQHITVAPEIDGSVSERNYTLSSSPGRSTDISITVKEDPKGKVSRWLHQHLIPGQSLSAKGPKGDFHLGNSALKKKLFIAAGSGITPILSMLRELVDHQVNEDLILIYQVRKPEDLICRQELEWLAAQHPATKIHWLVTQPDRQWTGHSGRLSEAQLALLVPDLTERAVFCCGPDGFIRQSKDHCQQLGLKPEQWFSESFTIGETPTRENRDLSILFDSWDTVVTGNNQQTILQQGENEGLAMSSSCRAGLCGTCKVRLISGEVTQLQTAGLSEQEKQDNIILACSCLPDTDLVIEAI